jgi:hypothetical protein
VIRNFSCGLTMTAASRMAFMARATLGVEIPHPDKVGVRNEDHRRAGAGGGDRRADRSVDATRSRPPLRNRADKSVGATRRVRGDGDTK